MNTQSDQGKSVQSDQGTQDTDAETLKEKAVVTVGGKSYSNLEDMAKDYTSLTKEFHKRNQDNTKAEAAEEIKASGVENVEVLLEAFQKAGFATKDDIHALEQKRHRNSLVENTPELAGKTEMLETLQKAHPDMAIEDIIEKYGIAKKDKLKAARATGDVMGDSGRRRPTGVEEDLASLKSGKMTRDDFRKKHNVKGMTGLTKTKKIGV